MQVMDRALQQILDAAFTSHQAGQLEEAERLYRKLLRRAPLNPDGLHLLGLLRHQRGRSDEAESLIARAVKVRPDAVVFHENLAAIQRSRGALAAAIETCRAGLSRTASPRLTSMLLEALLDSGAFDQALTMLDGLDRIGPASADRLADRALCLFRLGRTEEAVAAAERSRSIDPDHGNAISVLADLATGRGDHGGAAELWRQALRRRPDWAAARINLGNSLLRHGDVAAAAEALSSMPLPADLGLATALLNGRAAVQRRLGADAAARRLLQAALVLAPAEAEGLSNLSDLRRGDDAMEALRLAGRALASDPFNAGAMSNRCLAEEELDRLHDALRSGRSAIALKPAGAEILNNLCSPLRWLGRFAEAEILNRRAIAADPGFAQARYGLGTLQLKLGDLENGWRNFEWRTHGGEGFSTRPFRQPPWQGTAPDGTLLVWGEQGLGDEIIYGSMLPDLARAGIRARVECDPRLVGVFSRTLPSLEFVARTTPPDPRLTGDDVTAQVPMGGLARWFRRRIEDFPAAAGYLRPRDGLVDRWRRCLDELGTGAKVGFAWRSSRGGGVARRVHPPIMEWAPVLAQGGATFVSLQYGESEDDLRSVESELGVRIHRFADLDLKDDLENVLALSVALDLTISTGTTAFCLPAASGRPVWLLAPESYYQMLGTERLPWCPSVRVYPHRYDLPWSATIGRIGGDLAGFMREARVACGV